METSINASMERLCLNDLLEKALCIPEYQRYYTWKETHVFDLLKDIFDRKTPYLMGTVILHLHDNEHGQQIMDIVDGQQRLVTLAILLWELVGNGHMEKSSLMESKFSEGSARVIRHNRSVIQDFLKGKAEDQKDDFKKRLLASDESSQDEFLLFDVLTLKGEDSALVLDRAFTFFDSTNSKGMPLTDFNLLKAHHLMFIPSKQESLAAQHNDEWESRNDKHPDIFSTILRRLRMWARGESRDSKIERPDYNEFCSVVEPELEINKEHLLNRYMQPVAFRSWRRVGDRIVLSMDYPALEGEKLVPTEINQTIEGGDPFFIYAKRYHELFEDLFGETKSKRSTEIDFIKGLANYITNSKLQNAFRAVMVLYYDKFGEDRLIEASVCLERIISQWRWEAKSVFIEGTLSHVSNNRLIPILLESVNSLHAYSQLLGICQKLSPLPVTFERNIQEGYFGSLKDFYKNEHEKIFDNQAKEMICNHYNIEN